MAEPTTDHSTATSALSRRTVLRIAAVSGAGAAVLVACGGDDTTTSDAGSDATGNSSGDTDSSAPAGSGGGSLVATADVPVGGGVVIEDRKVVVTQPAAGTFKAFTAVCTHQQCLVASVKNDRISCPCHGSVYNAKDGSVINGPAPRPLKEIAVTVQGDQIVES